MPYLILVLNGTLFSTFLISGAMKFRASEEAEKWWMWKGTENGVVLTASLRVRQNLPNRVESRCAQLLTLQLTAGRAGSEEATASFLL